MSPRVLFIAILCAALGCGLIAGVFFAFSTFVMPALGTERTNADASALLRRWVQGLH
jgi:uncharacterized membrane protein